jgi:glutaredoxin-like protein NrdH
MPKLEHVPGKKAGNIVLYALSTCGWCAKAKRLLGELGVEYSYAYLDQATGSDLEELTAELLRWNPQRSFPTILIKDQVIVGFNREKIMEAIN